MAPTEAQDPPATLSAEGLGGALADLERLRFHLTLLECQTEASLDGMIVVTADGRIVTINRRFADLWGLPPEVVASRSRDDVTRRVLEQLEDPQAFVARSDYLHEHPDELLAGELRLRDGRIFEHYSTPVRGADGTFYGRLGCYRDVTQRRMAEDQLRFQSALLRAQGEASLDGILNVGADGRILAFNRRFVEMWRIPDEVIATGTDEAALRAVQAQLVDPEAFLARVAYLYERPDEESRDELALTDGRTFDRYSAPVRDEQGTHYGRVWFFSDVTERRRAEAERLALLAREQAARAEAEAAVRARDQFLSVAAHELKTPITSLRGMSYLLLRRLHRGEPADLEKIESGVRMLYDQSDKLARLVSQLLDLSRIEAGKLALDRDDADLVRLARSAIARAEVTAPEHRFVLRAPDALPAVVDAVRLEQVLTNLLDNAVKYSPDGGEVEVALCSEDGVGATIAVRDRGVGIPAEHVERIFDRFYQAHEAGHFGGMGLGLAISRQIVDLHGGRIGVELPFDGGARFVITLPLRPGAAAG